MMKIMMRTVSVMVRAKHSSSGMAFFVLWETVIMTVITFHGLGPGTQCANTQKISKNPKLLSKPRKEEPKLSRLRALDADYWDKLPLKLGLPSKFFCGC